MRILYISNYRKPHGSIKDKIKFYLKPVNVNGQDGFFAASLYAASDIKEVDAMTFQRTPERYLSNTDVVCVNYKCDPRTNGASYEELEFVKKINKPKVLAVTNANAADLPGNQILDLFDLVFKREHYKDLEKYSVSDSNREKIRTTMLACPLVPYYPAFNRHPSIKKYGYKVPEKQQDYDVFFSGSNTADERIAVMQTLKQMENIDLKGGLQPRSSRGTFDEELIGPYYSYDQYIPLIRNTKINIAIEGYGQFTHRHLELMLLSSFYISSPSIRGLELPIPIVENKHYVAYDNHQDLKDKIVYYLGDHEKRYKIALEGRKIFEEYYNFDKHGKYIVENIKAIL